MLAAWYERPGPAAEVLQVGEMAAPEPGPGEVRVRVSVSGINSGDTKKRGDWVGYGLPFPRVVPHSDGSGIVDIVGQGVDPGRVGQRVWVHGAQSYRPFGTAAQLTVVPADQAVELPDDVDDETGACLGIPGITAHRAVFGDGPVAGKTVLVQGALGAVGSLAAQLARWGGATVIGTVRRRSDIDQLGSAVEHGVALDDEKPAETIRAHAPEGVHRIIEVAFSDNAGPTSPSGPCSSPTSRSDCSAATTSRTRRNAKPPTTSPPLHRRERSRYRSASRRPCIRSPKPTNASRLVLESAYC